MKPHISTVPVPSAPFADALQTKETAPSTRKVSPSLFYVECLTWNFFHSLTGVEVWGANVFDQTDVPRNLTNVIANGGGNTNLGNQSNQRGGRYAYVMQMVHFSPTQLQADAFEPQLKYRKYLSSKTATEGMRTTKHTKTLNGGKKNGRGSEKHRRDATNAEKDKGFNRRCRRWAQMKKFQKNRTFNRQLCTLDLEIHRKLRMIWTIAVQRSGAVAKTEYGQKSPPCGRTLVNTELS
jgi:hypothetical protein